MLFFKDYRALMNDNIVLSEAVRFLVQRTPLPNIVYVGNIDKSLLDEPLSDTQITFIGDAKLLDLKEGTNVKIVNCNLEKGLPKLEPKIFENSVVIVDHVISNMTNPKVFLKDIRRYLDNIPSLLFCEDKTVESELSSLLSYFEFGKGFWGNISEEPYSKDHKKVLYIGGYLSNIVKIEDSKLRVCAIISTFNEEDIIEQVCNHLLDQDIFVHVIDNWSTDSTLNIIQDLAEENKRISWEVYPDNYSPQYAWEDILNKKIDFAISKDFDWYIHYDADEIREGCFEKTSLKESIAFVDSLGFNAIDHTVIDFRPVKDGFNKSFDPKSYFEYFEFGNRPGHFAQIKAWKNMRNVEYDLSSSGGHVINFQGIKIYPYKFLLKHYPLRSREHMLKKIYKERLPRYEKEKKEKGWHTHYDKYKDKKESISLWNEEELICYDNAFYKEFLLERLFGTNVVKS